MPLRWSLIIYPIVHICYLCSFNTIFMIINRDFWRAKVQKRKKISTCNLNNKGGTQHSSFSPGSPGNLDLRVKVEVWFLLFTPATALYSEQGCHAQSWDKGRYRRTLDTDKTWSYLQLCNILVSMTWKWKSVAISINEQLKQWA